MNSADVIGYLLAIMIVPTAYFTGASKGGRQGATVLVLAVSSHLVVALLSISDIFLPPTADTLALHNRAVDFAVGLRSADFKLPSSSAWSYAISYVYMYFGSSIWLGFALNQWVFFLATLQLAAFAGDIGAAREKWRSVMVFSVMPSSILFCNFLLRESFQILCLILVVRMLDRYRRDGALKWLIAAGVFFLPFGVIHNGFFLFGPVALAIGIFARAVLSPQIGRRRLSLSGRVFVTVFGVVIVGGAMAFLSTAASENGRISDIVEGEIDVADGLASSAERGARTVFPWAPPAGISGVLVGAPVLLVQFIAAPIVPFMIRQSSDLVAGLDTLVRLVILYGAIRFYRFCGPSDRKALTFFALMYFAFCFLASVGTSTVGTAMRHNLKMVWVLIPFGLAGLKMSVRQPGRPVPHRLGRSTG